MGARHQPLRAPEYGDDARAAAQRARQAAELSGNSLDDPQADWVDYQAIGVADGDGLSQRLVELLDVVDLCDDRHQLVRRGTVAPERHPEATAAILAARATLTGRPPR